MNSHVELPHTEGRRKELSHALCFRGSVLQQDTISSEGVAVSEMAVVDTFTKLIFGEQNNYSSLELLIIAAFRAVELNVLRDTHFEMGAYLRNLGVREMIQLVARLQAQLKNPVDAIAGVADPLKSPSVHVSVGSRLTH